MMKAAVRIWLCALVTLQGMGSPVNSITDEVDAFGDEVKLLHTLMHRYNSAVRPVDKASSIITVKLNFTLTQILDMDEKNQILTTNVWLSHEWRDEMLTWDPARYNGLERLRLSPDLIWKPDIVLYNGVDDVTDHAYSHCLAMVHHDGKVFWGPNLNLRSSCKFNLTFFPFDDQVCKLKFGSWTYDKSQVDLINSSSELSLDQYTVHGGWDLLKTKVERNVVLYPCCSESFPDVTFSMYMRRRTLYHVNNVILPCLLLSVLSLLGFWLPVSSSEKVTMGLTVLLAFFVLGLSIANRIPETSEYIPLIGIYLNCIMILTTISVIMCVFIIHIHNRCPFKPANTLITWFYKFTITYLNRTPFTCSKKCDHSQFLRHQAKVSSASPDEDMSPLNLQKKASDRQLFRLVQTKNKGNYILCLQEADLGKGMSNGEQARRKKFIAPRSKKEDRSLQWQRVAEIWDKIFFWIELGAVSVCTVVILLVIPACKKSAPMM